MKLSKEITKLIGEEPIIVVDDTMEVAYIDWNLLVPYQGNLKERKSENELKMLNSLVKNGFFDIKKVWKDPISNVIYILDGHQTVGTLENYSQYIEAGLIKMIKSSNSEPTNKIPCVFINANDRADLDKKLLLINSHFGEITKEGLAEFIQTRNIDTLFLRELPENIGWNLGENHWQTNTIEWIEAAQNPIMPIETNEPNVEGEEKPIKELEAKEETEKEDKVYEQSDTHEISFVLNEQDHKYILSLINKVKVNQMYESNAEALLYIFQQADLYVINIP